MWFSKLSSGQVVTEHLCFKLRRIDDRCSDMCFLYGRGDQTGNFNAADLPSFSSRNFQFGVPQFTTLETLSDQHNRFRAGTQFRAILHEVASRGKPPEVVKPNGSTSLPGKRKAMR